MSPSTIPAALPFRTLDTTYWTSTDNTITLPIEVHLYSDGRAVACYDGSADVAYPSLAALLDAHRVATDTYTLSADDGSTPVEAPTVETAAILLAVRSGHRYDAVRDEIDLRDTIEAVGGYGTLHGPEGIIWRIPR